MVTITADVTDGIREIVQKLVRNGLYKSQSEVIRDAIRQLNHKYALTNISLEDVREITSRAAKKSGKTLSKTLKEIRDNV